MYFVSDVHLLYNDVYVTLQEWSAVYSRTLVLSPSLLTDDKPEKNCTPRAIEEFPDNFLTVQQTKDGGMAIHIFLSLYMFGALAIVCDDYFVSSLEVICDRKYN